MSSGKYLSLEEARKQKALDRFCKEHPSTGDEEQFDEALNAMASGKPSAKHQTSDADASED